MLAALSWGLVFVGLHSPRAADAAIVSSRSMQSVVVASGAAQKRTSPAAAKHASSGSAGDRVIVDRSRYQHRPRRTK